MGRFTAYDQNGRMVADFDKSEYDFLRRYGRTPEEVLDENAKLRKLVHDMWYDGMCECDEYDACTKCKYHFPDYMRELGIENGS